MQKFINEMSHLRSLSICGKIFELLSKKIDNDPELIHPALKTKRERSAHLNNY